MEVTCVHWHPSEKNIVMTSSLDGTIRLWDLTGEAAFGNLINKSVLKIKASVGNGRNGCTSCIFAPNATRIFGGCADATIHIFLVKKLYSRADAVLKMPDSCKSPVTALAVSACSALLATRSEGGNITLWEVGKLPGVLLKLIMGVENQYSYANVEFSPDGSLLFFGTSPLDKTPTAKSHLLFFETGQNTNKASNSSSSSSSKGSSVTPLMASEAFMKVGVATGASVIAVKWQANTKQLLCRYCYSHHSMYSIYAI